MSKILIKNGTVLTMDNKVLQADILIDKDKISDIAPNIDEKSLKIEKVIDAKGKMVMPGFINAHTHTGMSLFRSMLSDNSNTKDNRISICNVESKLTKQDIYNAAMLSIIEMIKSGTTTFCDSFSGEEEVARATKEAGLRGILSRCICGKIESANKCLDEAEDFYNKWNNQENGRIKVVLSLDSAQNCEPETIRNTVSLAKKLKTQIHMHYLENKEEIRVVKERYNKTVTEYLKTNNLFNVDVVLAHGVWADEMDLGELQFHDVSIVTNPISNCMLGSGMADLKFLLDGGINVAIGTDGQEACNTLDMFQEIRQCAFSQKLLYKDADVIDAKKVLEMATIKSAKALKLAGNIGTIEKGKKADIIIVNINKPHMIPLRDPYAAIAYSACGEDVETTIVDGKILMENRKILFTSESKAIDAVNKIVKRLF